MEGVCVHPRRPLPTRPHHVVVLLHRKRILAGRQQKRGGAVKQTEKRIPGTPPPPLASCQYIATGARCGPRPDCAYPSQGQLHTGQAKGPDVAGGRVLTLRRRQQPEPFRRNVLARPTTARRERKVKKKKGQQKSIPGDTHKSHHHTKHSLPSFQSTLPVAPMTGHSGL